MDLFEKLRAVALTQSKDGKFPVWLLADILEKIIKASARRLEIKYSQLLGAIVRGSTSPASGTLRI